MDSRVSHRGTIGLALAGFTFWVLADTSMKLAGNSRLPAYEIVACLGLALAIALVARGFLQGTPRRLLPKSPARQLVRSLLDLGNNLCVVVALRHLPLTLFYILVFLAPMMTALLSAVFLRERLGWRKVVAVVGGFVGVVIAVNPFSSARREDWIGYAACMVCVLCFSVNMVWSRVLMRAETPESLTLFSGVVQVVVGAVLMMAWRARDAAAGGHAHSHGPVLRVRKYVLFRGAQEHFRRACVAVPLHAAHHRRVAHVADLARDAHGVDDGRQRVDCGCGVADGCRHVPRER
jgi:drug/metabolite transporter (DMT)-like permease